MRACVGRSGVVMLRNVGLAAAPDAGPINAVFLACVFSVAVTVPLLVSAAEGVELRTVPSPVKVTLVTVPVGAAVHPAPLPFALMPRA